MSARVFCTVITKSYLAHARALARSLETHHPGCRLYVLFADNPDGYFDPEMEAFDSILLSTLVEQETIRRMCFYYTGFELCNALKPFLHEYLSHKTDFEQWVYLDSDVLVCSSLEPAFAILKETSILLSPHVTQACPPTLARPVETNLLRCGVFNGGFLGLRRGADAERFIAWLKARLERLCFDGEQDVFVDQLWLNLVPQYFRDCAVFSHPGANVAYWNLHERELRRGPDGTVTSNGEQLLFFHFSGWDPRNPRQLSRHAVGYDLPANDAWSGLAEHYRDELVGNGYEVASQWPYSFGQFVTGEQITLPMRRRYHGEVWRGDASDESPFMSAARYRDPAPSLLRSVLRRYLPSPVRSRLRQATNLCSRCLPSSTTVS